MLQVADVTGMQQVEDAVGKDDGLACSAELLREGDGFRDSEH
jgi:hypothetical protein